MYNFMLAFVICASAYLIGDFVAKITKAWVPSVFVTAVVLLLGYWTVLPKELVSDSLLIPFGSTLGIYLLITHMGTVISLKQLIQQWRTIVVCLSGLLGMCLLDISSRLSWHKVLVIAGLPPLTGGIVAATMMQTAAADAGFETAAVFAIAMYCVQGFAGYPLTAICLQAEGRRLLRISAQARSCDRNRTEKKWPASNDRGADDSDRKTLIPKILTSGIHLY